MSRTPRLETQASCTVSSRNCASRGGAARRTAGAVGGQHGPDGPPDGPVAEEPDHAIVDLVELVTPALQGGVRGDEAGYGRGAGRGCGPGVLAGGAGRGCWPGVLAGDVAGAMGLALGRS